MNTVAIGDDRTTTGQMISMDYVIRQIAAELWAEELAEVKEGAE